MSSKEIRKHISILENSEDKSLKIKRLLYTYTIGLLQIPSSYKDNVKAALEDRTFYITGYDTVYREARNLLRREQEYAEYDEVFDLHDHTLHIYDAIVDAIDEIITLLVVYMQETFEVVIKPRQIPSNDVLVLIDAVYAIYTGRRYR